MTYSVFEQCVFFSYTQRKFGKVDQFLLKYERLSLSLKKFS